VGCPLIQGSARGDQRGRTCDRSPACASAGGTDYPRPHGVRRAAGEQLKPARSEQVRAQVGDWYVLNVKRNGVVREDVNLEAIARECGALKDWEVVSLP
jgi:hypothetical protein